MELLTSGSERLLTEILAHCNQSGMPDPEYWEKRFENLSDSEDSILRSQFKELENKEMIFVEWADDAPYYINILNNGKSYSSEIKKQQRQARSERRVNLFWQLVIDLSIAIISFLLGKYFG